MESLSQSIITSAQSIPLGIQIVFLAASSFAEGLPIIGSVLPGGTIALFAGSLSASGSLPPFAACLLVGISSFAGDMTGFMLGKKFRNWRVIKKIIEHEDYQKSWDVFDRHIAIISIFGKLVPVVRSAPSALAGARGIKARTYAVYSFIGSMLWGIVGIYAGNIIGTYASGWAVWVIIGIVAGSVIFTGIWKRLKKRS